MPAPTATPAEQVIQGILAPFIREFGEVREELGRERERREQAEREGDALQTRVDASALVAADALQNAREPLRPWWRRLFRNQA